MSYYSDQLKKIDYYKSRIINDLAKKGVYPEDNRINKQIKNIDTMLGVFQYKPVAFGEEFDTKKFNDDLECIYQDLRILYELAYELTVKDFEELQTYCETHLSELNKMARHYQYRTKLELDSTYLGTTVLYQSDGYNALMDNGTLTIDLGDIEVEEQSKLACIIDSQEVNVNNVIFSFTDSDGIVSVCSPYSYNNDFFIVPGNLKVNTYNFELNDDTIYSSFICTPDELVDKVNHDNRYILFGGRNFISIGYVNKKYMKKTDNVQLYDSDPGIFEFYIVNGTYANFEFSSEPSSKNFDGYEIKDIPRHQKIVIEHGANFAFDFATDGEIYATKKEAEILNNELYYPYPDQITDIMIEEYSVGEKKSYSVKLTAGPFYNGNIPNINAIAIKQLSMLEGLNV